MSEPVTPPPRINGQIVLEAAHWFASNRHGGLQPADAKAFMQWLQASPQHVAEYLQLAAIAAYAPGALERDPAALDELIAQAGIGENVVGLAPDDRFPVARKAFGKPARPRKHRARILGVAALLVVATAIGAVWTWIDRADQRSYSTAHGQQQEWKLPDGTLLRLNSESTVTIRFDREKRQADVVHGQAVFDVARNAGRPFEVRAGPHLVEDIGTRFDIHRHGAETTVTVVEGRVHVWTLEAAALRESIGNPSPLLELGAGERARISAAGVVSQRASIDERTAMAWAREEIVFEDEPLANVVTEFNRYAVRPMRIGESEIGELRISGTFGIGEEETFHAFLDSLPGIRTEIVADGVTIGRRVPRQR
jgi:transmembrane sensor